MKNKLIQSFCFLLAITILAIPFPAFAATNNQDAKVNDVFSFEKDGYWGPADCVTHDFVIGNAWNRKCYLDTLCFNRDYIEDVVTKEQYFLEEAIEAGIIKDYDVVIINKSSLSGKEEIFNGKLMELEEKKIVLQEPILLEKDEQADFSMEISFNALAGNEYQNKKYRYVFVPEGYAIDPDTSKPITGQNNSLPLLFCAIVSSTVAIISVIFYKRRKRVAEQ